MIKPIIYDNLLELADELLSKFPTFIPVLNDMIDDKEVTLDTPRIPIYFTSLTNDEYPEINLYNEKYVYCIIGNYFYQFTFKETNFAGYVKKEWVKNSPQFVYPVFYNGEYTFDVFLTKKEARACALKHTKKLIKEGFTFGNID